ncbi:acetyltransferase [Cetobacterium sp.]|uniref:acetyltransferase n=1 Tax=Cetobacterium sp. TaxID=2071632 RepID=UPI003F339E10
MKKVIIFGIGDLAKELYIYIKGYKNVIGFCVDNQYWDKEKKFFEGKIVYKISDFTPKDFEDIYFITTIGYKNMRSKKKKYLELKRKGIKFTNFIHKSVIYENDLQIGENNIIFPGVIIEPGVKIGDNNIIWTRNVICHDVEIGSHNFIAAASLVGGFSKILDNNFIGFNSTINHNIIIEKEVLIGAKSLVNRNTKNYTKNYGIPSKEISTHEEKGIEFEE